MAEGFRDPAERHHVKPVLPPLNLRHEALRAPQEGCELNLRNAGSLPSCDKELDEFLMPLREDRRWQ